MEEVTRFKAILTTIFGVISSLIGVLAIPVLLLVGCNVIDYITALMASPYRGKKVDSNIGIKGIVKKVCMWLLVVVGAIVDSLIRYSVQTIGIAFPFTYLIACIVAIWLVCNEILSILENIKDTGTELPAFLEKLVKNLKTQVENKTESEDK